MLQNNILNWVWNFLETSGGLEFRGHICANDINTNYLSMVGYWSPVYEWGYIQREYKVKDRA